MSHLDDDYVPETESDSSECESSSDDAENIMNKGANNNVSFTREIVMDIINNALDYINNKNRLTFTNETLKRNENRIHIIEDIMISPPTSSSEEVSNFITYSIMNSIIEETYDTAITVEEKKKY